MAMIESAASRIDSTCEARCSVFGASVRREVEAKAREQDDAAAAIQGEQRQCHAEVARLQEALAAATQGLEQELRGLGQNIRSQELQMEEIGQALRAEQN